MNKILKQKRTNNKSRNRIIKVNSFILKKQITITNHHGNPKRNKSKQ